MNKFASVFLLNILFLSFLYAAEPIIEVSESERRTKLVEVIAKSAESVVILQRDSIDEFNTKKEIIGTGFFINDTGLIATASHVVKSQKSINVKTKDGKKLVGKVLVADPSRDCALVKIDIHSKPLKFAKNILLGETVVAIGHPFKYQFSASQGIISALSRQVDMPDGRKIKEAFQTSASVNPGNSGGPLLNMDGEVVGMIIAMRESAQNIAFCIKPVLIEQEVKALKQESSPSE
jgi:serine protease Do